MDIVGKRYTYFAISLSLIVPGLIGLIIWGLPLAVDFAGGSIVEIRFVSGNVPTLQDVRDVYANFGETDAEPRLSGTDEMVIRTKHMSDATNAEILKAMQDQFGTEVLMLRFESVGPTIGREVTIRAIGTIAMAAIAILLYIWYAFRGIKNSYRYGVSAIIAMLHDVAVVFGMQAIISHFFGWEVDALFLTALLTVISFSVHDSIVVFDRIRENSGRLRRENYESVVNQSIVQTMTRSINTQLTVFLTLLALLLFGGSTIRHFIVILMIGLLSGTYSSIFNAAPILVVWENREWKTWFRKNKSSAAA
ncbi:MAG TPA: protein translocase subunit SecF [Chloroflexi bacterium]|nr:protein translocase subunit SecF [Chloroflexota bacterium]